MAGAHQTGCNLTLIAVGRKIRHTAGKVGVWHVGGGEQGHPEIACNRGIAVQHGGVRCVL